MVGRSKASLSGRCRVAVLSRVLAAVIGGYLLVTLFTACLTLFLPLIVSQPRGETVLAATLPAFLILCVAVVWVFAARSAWRAWLGLSVTCLLLALGYVSLSETWLWSVAR